MVFSSTAFLYFFLPLTLLLYFGLPMRCRNGVLLLASLLFYAWGELGYVVLMLASITINWAVGLHIATAQRQGRNAKGVLTLGLVLNLLPLLIFKYANFAADGFSHLLQLGGLSPIELAPVHLPIGISFFTFQAISYIVDVYRQHAAVQPRLDRLALYIALFPQLIAGPIVRYRTIAAQINQRATRLDDIASGTLLFIIGLGKKVLIANSMGAVADQAFALPMQDVGTGLAWLGILAYTLQIYFDFSGYSDMAIGLGRIFGFRFLENFNYPYIARSVQDFWRRWHISLSTWFRDYLYIPLGGNRAGIGRTYFNLLLVFLLCGLWHGASWTFVLWGLYHGTFLVIERLGLGRILSKLPALLGWAYTLLVVMIGWVFFRADDLPHALTYIQRLFEFKQVVYLDAYLFEAISPQFYIALIAGLALSTPWPYRIVQWLGYRLFGADPHEESNSSAPPISPALDTTQGLLKGIVLSAWAISILVICTAQLLTNNYNPFLYFRF